MENKVEFLSDGVKLVGTLFRPEGATGRLPTVVGAGGWCYTKEIVLPHIARIVNEAGVQFLGFDYAGFGESDGERRQHLDPWRQISDYRNAISYVEGRDDVDPNRLGAFGISYSGGHVLILAAIDPRIKAVVGVVPVVDGFANMRRVHGETRFRDYENAVLQDRRERAKGGGGGRIAFATDTPATVLSVWPFSHVYKAFNELKKTEAPLHEHWSTLESAELLLNYTVHPYLERILDKKLLLILAEADNITAWDMEIEVFNKIPSPYKRLEILPSVSHMSLYTEQPDTNLAAHHTRDWFAAAFGQK
ncbi:alpha/beta-hydrolase [Pyrenochaeta sp. DS3sAY3a]|nr:alpha/beta-hydrolase [Pyrenochaeta sp. DS3sAY3a]